jgi:diguanylate cyclase (GGDEF)-like protein
VSFRNRLTFFFILLVIVPVLAVAGVGMLLVSNSEEARDREAIEQAQQAAQGLFEVAKMRAETVAETVQTDDRLAVAIRDGDRTAQQARLEALNKRTDAVRARLTLDGAAPVQAPGTGEAVAAETSDVVDADGNRAGEITLSVTTAQDFADAIQRVTGLDAVLTEGGKVLAGTVEGAPGEIPEEGEVDVGGETFQATGFETETFNERDMLGVHVLIPEAELEDSVAATLWIPLILIAFLASALAFALTAARSLGRQTARLVAAAKQIGAGDFSVSVPTEGDDEFAQLGREFNSMASQLQAREEELLTARLRVGESVASKTDRDEQLRIAVQTAVEDTGAETGRVVMRQSSNGSLEEAARAGDVGGALAAVRAVEDAALRTGEPAEKSIGGFTALARPLASPGPDGPVVGAFSIARAGEPFSDRDHDMLRFFTTQAALSLENVSLHETIKQQAVTDELTGLFNQRRFQEVIADEVERVRRLGDPLGLIMLDIDDFKLVNDMHGHLQGDEVLRAVARVLRETSREIDEPARYGGEEMAVALPGTGLQGTYDAAERVRRRIEGLEVPLLVGAGTVRVTASCGVAAVPESVTPDKDALVAAADAALYRAKRSGKNRTVKAG